MYKETNITHDGRKTGKSNLRLLEGDGMSVLMSYTTPVALKYFNSDGSESKWFFTRHKFSSTTSRQITCFLNAQGEGRKGGVETDHVYIAEGMKEMCRKHKLNSSVFNLV